MELNQDSTTHMNSNININIVAGQKNAYNKDQLSFQKFKDNNKNTSTNNKCLTLRSITSNTILNLSPIVNNLNNDNTKVVTKVNKKTTQPRINFHVINIENLKFKQNSKKSKITKANETQEKEEKNNSNVVLALTGCITEGKKKYRVVKIQKKDLIEEFKGGYVNTDQKSSKVITKRLKPIYYFLNKLSKNKSALGEGIFPKLNHNFQNSNVINNISNHTEENVIRSCKTPNSFINTTSSNFFIGSDRINCLNKVKSLHSNKQNEDFKITNSEMVFKYTNFNTELAIPSTANRKLQPIKGLKTLKNIHFKNVLLKSKNNEYLTNKNLFINEHIKESIAKDNKLLNTYQKKEKFKLINLIKF